MIKQNQNKMKESTQIKNVELWNLQDESCIRCGGALTQYSLCAVCKQSMQNICAQCGSKSEWMHHHCHLHLDVYQTRNSMIENTYLISAWQL